MTGSFKHCAMVAVLLCAGIEPAVAADALIDVGARRAEIAAAPWLAAACAAPAHRFAPLPPVAGLAGRERGGSDAAAQPFSWQAMLGAARALAGDVAAAEATLASFDAWAGADALAELAEVGARRSNTNSLYALRRSLFPAILAWSVITAAVPVAAERRAAVEAWLARLVVIADQDSGGRNGRGRGSSNRNNHRLLRDAVNMAWGIHAGEPARYERGRAGFLAMLRQMRPDGGLPFELARGARALWYQRHAVASLVAMAEMAAGRGDDLYGLEIEGRSLHRAIGFLLDGIADPARHDLAGQDLGFLENRGGRNYMAWIEPYLRRFPASAISARLRALDGGRLLARRPLVDEISGGALTCLFAR